MNFGICKVSISPVRAEASDRSEMVTQLLFGEKVEVLKTKKNWIKIKADFDAYEGWIDEKHLQEISQDEFFNTESPCLYTAEPFNLIVAHNEPTTLPLGAEIRNAEGGTFQLGEDTYEIFCETKQVQGLISREELILLAKNYLNVPYLWGGKSNFGIDCSGLVQQVYKFAKIHLPRDAKDQAQKGEMLGFVEEALPGDLAFFDNDEGQIIHVGIIIKNQHILHAHGKVRIDPIDSTGIFNTDMQKYSHKLRFIKRILPE
uniref:C40 family peptidase n=1 Tax=Ornithobacterium rhinotracheale TaxID=28251 RepID=UPI0039A76110